MRDLGKIKEFLKLAKFKILLGVLGLSILITATLGGYIVGQNKSVFESFQVSQPQPSQTPAATPTPTAQGTAKVTLTSPQPTSSPSPTQAPTPTPTAQVEISFSADKTILARGQCTKLNWNVSNASSVSLVIGSGSPETVAMGNQTKEVCPLFSKGLSNPINDDTTYTLKVKKLDGSTEERKVVVTVKPIIVKTTFISLKVLNDADADFLAKNKGEVRFEFTVPYNGGKWPSGGLFASVGSGEQMDISNDPVRVSPLAIFENYTLEVRGFEDDAGTTQSLGIVSFTLPGPPSSSWNNTYTSTSSLADGQFEITFTLNVTHP